MRARSLGIALSMAESNAATGEAGAWGNAAVDKEGERIVIRVGDGAMAWSGFIIHSRKRWTSPTRN